MGPGVDVARVDDDPFFLVVELGKDVASNRFGVLVGKDEEMVGGIGAVAVKDVFDDRHARITVADDDIMVSQPIGAFSFFISLDSFSK